MNEYNKISMVDDMNVVELGLRNNNNNKLETFIPTFHD